MFPINHFMKTFWSCPPRLINSKVMQIKIIFLDDYSLQVNNPLILVITWSQLAYIGLFSLVKRSSITGAYMPPLLWCDTLGSSWPP